MKGCKHLTWHDRLKIDTLIREGKQQNEIAAALHVSESTISRELRRCTYEHINSDLTTETRYNPDGAQKRYDANKTAKGPALKIGNDHAPANHIEGKIADDKYSPCAVLAEIIRKGLKFSVTICRATLYKYIAAGLFLRITNKDLPFRGMRQKHKTRRVRAARPAKGESIEKRQNNINDRAEFGHREMDLVESCRAGKSYVPVLTERLTRHEITAKIPDKQAASVIAALGGIERTTCYYCHPYSSYERGSNEKQNQMLRRQFPKGTNFDTVPESELQRMTAWLNNYPRKIFEWGTSGERFDLALANL